MNAPLKRFLVSRDGLIHLLIHTFLYKLTLQTVRMCVCVSVHAIVSDFVTPWTVYSPLGSSAHRIFQARILEPVAISSPRGSPQPRDQTHVSCLAGGFFTTEPPEKSQIIESDLQFIWVYT